MPLHATTQRAKQKRSGRRSCRLREMRHARMPSTRRRVYLDAAAAWLKKPWPQKLSDAVGECRDAMASPITYSSAAGILRTGGKLADAVDHAADAAGQPEARRRQRRSEVRKAAAGEVAEHTDEAAARRLLQDAPEANASGVDRHGQYTDGMGNVHAGGVPPYQTSIPRYRPEQRFPR